MNDRATTAASNGRRPPRRRRWLRALVLSVLVFVAVLAGALAFFVATQTGLRAIQGLVERVVPSTLLTLDSVDGRLIDEAAFNGLVLHLPTADIEIGRLALAWRPARLLDGELVIEALDIARTRVALLPSDEPSPPLESLPEVILPVRLVLRRLVVDDFALTAEPGADPVEVRSLALEADWKGATLAIERLAVSADAPAIEANLKGRFALEAAYPLEAEIDWQFTPPQGHAIGGRARLEGDTDRLKVRHDTTGLFGSVAEAELTDLMGTPGWNARLELDSFKLRDLDPAQPDIALTARVDSAGGLDGFQLDGAVDAVVNGIESMEGLGPVHGRFSAVLEADELTVSRLEMDAEGSPLRLGGRGKMQIGGVEAGRFDGRLEWTDLNWPPVGDAQYRVPEGVLHIAGNTQAYRHELEGRFEGEGLPPVRFSGQGSGDTDSLTFEPLALEMLDGSLAANGRLAWAPTLAWQFDIRSEGLDPGRQWPELPGRLDALVKVEGTLADALDLRLDIQSIAGQLQERPLDGRGVVRVDGSRVAIDDLTLDAGPNHLAVAGSVDENLDLKLDLDAPELGVLVPGASGALAVEAKVEGTLEQPRIDARLSADALNVGTLALTSAKGHAKVEADPKGAVDVDLRVTQLSAGGLFWDKALVTVKGAADAHDFNLSLDGAMLGLATAGSGGWTMGGGYEGSLDRLALTHPDAGEWRLSERVAFAGGPGQWRVGRACLSSVTKVGSACVEAEGNDGANWHLRAEMPRLGLEAAAPFLAEDMSLEGELRMKADFTARDNLLEGGADLEVVSGKAGMEFDAGAQHLDFSGTALRVEAGAPALSAVLDLPLAGVGRLDGKFRLDGWRLDAPARPGQPINATLTGRLSDLAPLVSVVPQLSEVGGTIDVDLKLDGTLGQARFSGGARLADGVFEVPAAGVRVHDLSFDAASRGGDVLTFEGSGFIGEGRFNLGGKTRFTGKGPAATFTLKGERLTVADVPEATVVVTPDLAFTMEQGRAELTGEIFVPEAVLKPRSLPEGSVAPSSDVVIKGKEESGELKLATAADIRLRLGDQVRFDGFGLRATVRGDLRITQESGRLAMGNGELALREGTLATFGEELTIEQGRLLFANTPVSNPGINVVATRKLTDATVGARVSGTLKNRQVTLFADPPMGQAEALNYLLTGGSTRGGSGGAQVVGGNLVVKELGRRVGLEDVGVTQSEDSDDLSVYVGHYLTPQLYVQYINEMGQLSDKVRLRYDLSKNIQVEAETGDVQSADIFYTIER